MSPEAGPGPGVLLLHSFWGLDGSVRESANALADAGFTVLAPDLAHGGTYDDTDAALAALAGVDVNVNASLVQSSVGILRRAQADPSRPIGVVGFGPGASWALWLSVRLVDEVSVVVGYYGSQSASMDGSNSSYLCHWAEADAHVRDVEIAELGLSLQLAKREFRFEHHAGTIDGFAEKNRPGFNAGAEVVAWRQTIEFLAGALTYSYDS